MTVNPVRYHRVNKPGLGLTASGAALQLRGRMMSSSTEIRLSDPATPESLTLADLPSPNTNRWVARRKAEVVAAVQAGLLPLEEALRLYRLTIEEFASWQRALLRYGTGGLKASRLHAAEARERLGRARKGWSRRGSAARRRAHG
jgi:hypothetical protein